MPHNEFHPAASHMQNRASKFSLAGEGNPIGDTMEAQEGNGTENWNRGLNDGTPNIDPFDGPKGLEGDHMKALLTLSIESTRLGASSPAQSKQWLGPGPDGDLDMEGEQPNIFTAGLGQSDGLQVEGNDLHVHLLNGQYSYTHGAGTPWQTTETIGDTTAPGDITPDSITDDIVNSAAGQSTPTWQYFNDGPNTAFNG